MLTQLSFCRIEILPRVELKISTVLRYQSRSPLVVYFLPRVSLNPFEALLKMLESEGRPPELNFLGHQITSR